MSTPTTTSWAHLQSPSSPVLSSSITSQRLSTSAALALMRSSSHSSLHTRVSSVTTWLRYSIRTGSRQEALSFRQSLSVLLHLMTRHVRGSRASRQSRSTAETRLRSTLTRAVLLQTVSELQVLTRQVQAVQAQASVCSVSPL